MAGIADILENIQAQLSELIEHGPVADLRSTLKAVVSQQLSTLDLVTREEFDALQAVLMATRARVEALEARLGEAPIQTGPGQV